MNEELELKFSEKLIKQLNAMSEEELSRLLDDNKLFAFRSKYVNAAQRKGVCMRIKSELYERICDFCNMTGEFGKRAKKKSSLNGFVETLSEIFLANIDDDEMVDKYFASYDANTPKKEKEPRRVGTQRRPKEATEENATEEQKSEEEEK